MQVGEHELHSLRRALRDLLALTTLPAIWSNYQPQDIAKSLTDVLLTTLHLDMVYMRLQRTQDEMPLELVRTGQRYITDEAAQRIGSLFTPYLTSDAPNAGLSLADPLDEGATLQIAVIPIRHDALGGFVVIGVKSPKSITEIDRLLLSVAVNQAVTALQQTQLVSDLRIANQLKSNLLLKEQLVRMGAEAAQRRMRFLAEASVVLAGSPDYENALAYVMEIAVPAVADCCTIVLLEETGEVRSINTVAKTQRLQDIFMQLRTLVPLDLGGTSATAQVIRTGKSLLVSEIDASMVQQYAINAEHMALLRELNIQSSLVVALQARGQTLGAIALSRCEEGLHYDEDDVALAEGLAHRIGVALDRDRLYKAERKAREELQIRVQLQALISDLGQQALISDNIPELMNKAATVLTQSLGVEFSKILELQRDKNRLLLKAGVGWRPGHIGKTILSTGLESQSGYTLLSSQPVIVEDLATETRFHGPPLLLDHKVVSGVSVIIQGHEGPWGVLGVHSSRHRTFTSDDIHFVQSAANILGAALERARWYAEAQKTATLQERQRIARELHDAVSQTLFAANLMAESLPRLWERQPDKALMRTQQLHQLTRGAAAEMRVLLIELRPESVINADLGYLLSQLGYAMPGRQNIDISVRILGWKEQPLPPDAQMTFYRIAQESLNNVIKHGQAKQARIRLVQKDARVMLVITDNGRGFELRRGGTGLGLKSMWERANSIHAAFNIKSRVGRGTQVKLVWDIPSSTSSPT